MSLDSPTVGVVTPVYQGLPYLKECIDSVVAQTFSDWEYVILDNASTDGSWELARDAARDDDRIRVHRNEETLPFVQNWNRAIELAAPDCRYIKVVHADDWIEPDCLETMVGLAERDDGVSLVGAWVQRGDQVMCKWDEAPGEVVDGAEVARLSLLGRIPYLFGSPTSVLMRASAVRDQEKLYEEDDVDILGQVVDQDACYRLLEEGDFGYVRRVLSTTRVHEDSITSENERLARWYAGKLALHLRHGPVFLDESEYAARLEDWIDRYYRFLGKEVWSGRDRAFWKFHRHALDRLGTGFQTLRVAGSAAAFVGRRVGRGIARRVQSIGSGATP